MYQNLARKTSLEQTLSFTKILLMIQLEMSPIPFKQQWAAIQSKIYQHKLIYYIALKYWKDFVLNLHTWINFTEQGLKRLICNRKQADIQVFS